MCYPFQSCWSSTAFTLAQNKLKITISLVFGLPNQSHRFIKVLSPCGFSVSSHLGVALDSGIPKSALVPKIIVPQKNRGRQNNHKFCNKMALGSLDWRRKSKRIAAADRNFSQSVIQCQQTRKSWPEICRANCHLVHARGGFQGKLWVQHEQGKIFLKIVTGGFCFFYNQDLSSTCFIEYALNMRER